MNFGKGYIVAISILFRTSYASEITNVFFCNKCKLSVQAPQIFEALLDAEEKFSMGLQDIVQS